jgi:hypothetical protein
MMAALLPMALPHQSSHMVMMAGIFAMLQS